MECTVDDTPVEIKERVLQEFTDIAATSFGAVFTIGLLGDTEIGKTSICKCVQGLELEEEYRPTLGTGLVFTTVETSERAVEVRLRIWDMPGDSNQRNNVIDYLEGQTEFDALVIGYSVSDFQTFDNVDYWVELARRHLPKTVPTWLVGLKNDQSKRVSKMEGALLASKWDIRHMECTATNRATVMSVFQAISEVLHDNLEEQRAIAKLPKQKLEREALPELPQLPAHKVTYSKLEYPKQTYSFKILMLGPAECGKSALMARFTDDVFVYEHTPTLHPERDAIHMTVDDCDDVTVVVWDVPAAVEEAEEATLEDYDIGFGVGIAGIVLVVDVTDSDGLKKLEQYVKLLLVDDDEVNVGNNGHSTTATATPSGGSSTSDHMSGKVVLAATKTDCAGRKLSSQAIAYWAHTHKMECFEVSSKTGEDVCKPFAKLVSMIYEVNLQRVKEVESIATETRNMIPPQPPKWSLNDPSGVLFTEDQLRHLFNQLDVNKNGYISKDEFQQLFNRFDDFGLPVSMESMLQALPTKNRVLDSSRLSFNEFAVLMLKLARL